MLTLNDNLINLPENYLFTEVAKRIAAYRNSQPETELIRMDIGDVTLPLPTVATEAMTKAVADLSIPGTFHGYGPEQGYDFLREAIAKYDYRKRGIGIKPSEIFVSDGAKSDIGNLGELFSSKCIAAVMNPAYPAYVDDNVMDGRAGSLSNGRWDNLVYLECRPENGFLPEMPHKKVDIIYLCFPNNPTGVGITRAQLAEWVDYAVSNGSIIIFDSAYESYVRSEGIVRSVYEVPDAEKVAIEVRSYSKTAGFTGVRCGYTVVPEALEAKFPNGASGSLYKLWKRRQTTKFNGASYISQRGAEALYSEAGRKEIRTMTDYYLGNVAIIKQALLHTGADVFGGIDSPYVWAKLAGGGSSWEIFDRLLYGCGLSCTPGSGFGPVGEGYIRLTGFNSRENTLQAMNRIATNSSFAYET